ncbi:MAG TPA: hypothetical protein VFH83_16835, partial [Spirochaetia bacterium]|nr:hypothetical protein [Spirochaetia bacterium]
APIAVIGLLVVASLIAAAEAAGAAGTAGAADPGLTTTSAVDWAAGALVVDVSKVLDPSIPALPKAKETAQADIADRLSGILTLALGPVLVDSSHTFGQAVASDPSVFQAVAELVAAVSPRQAALTRDLSTLTVRYSLPFFGAGGIALPLLPTHGVAPRRRLGFVATRRYTGVLIYAKGPLSYVGTPETRLAQPALFPRLWDEQMNLVLDKGMCNPDDLGRWGMVGYAQSLDDSATLRAGASPLRITARGVFGDNATDIVISDDAAAQLLSLPENIGMLQQGRIVIVYESLPGPPSTP